MHVSLFNFLMNFDRSHTHIMYQAVIPFEAINNEIHWFFSVYMTEGREDRRIGKLACILQKLMYED